MSARGTGLPTRIHAIANARRGVTADTAERVARYFGGDAASWLTLQADYDLNFQILTVKSRAKK